MAKPYNHRRAENEYKKWKEKDELFMENNGMPMDKILLMRDFDRVQFNSDRRFFEKVDYDSEQKLSKAIQPDLPKLNDPQTVEDFLNSITSIAFAQSLEEFGFEMQLIIFLMYRGYSARFIDAEELAALTGVSKAGAYKIIQQLNEELKQKGYLIVRGRVIYPYFYERFFGKDDKNASIQR